MRTAPLAALAAFASLLAPAPGACADESSFACEGGIVAVGDGKLDLLAKCGVPALQDERRAELDGRRLVVAVEDWTYDLGPRRFTMRVTLERGKVKAIERGGYGFAESRQAFTPRRASCDASELKPGMGKLELVRRCGEPASKDAWQEERAASRVSPAAGQATSAVTVQVERWAYDFGPERFVHAVVLEDGTVVAVERGGHGYAR